MGENILVVDDEKEIADLLEVYLRSDGYTVYKFYSGTDALQCIEETDIDLAVLDVMLPDIDGFRICQKIRERLYFPVIMLTAKVEDGDKIMGLTVGADDYIRGLLINRDNHKCFLYDKELALTPGGIYLLYIFILHRNFTMKMMQL